MKKDDRMEIVQRQSYKVVKANEIIQRARYDLNITELKMLAYLISMIKPNDKAMMEYTFSIQDYCKICGIDYKNGGNYGAIKSSLKGLRDKSFWIKRPDGSEETVGWLGKAIISRGSGKITIQFDETLQKYITELYSNYTQYELFCTLPMSSAYSFRVYELLKSYQHKNKVYTHTFNIDDLKVQLAAPYQNFKDFRRKVLEVATKEINEFTDLEISWEPLTLGRKVVEVRFEVRVRNAIGRLETYSKSMKRLNKRNNDDGQMNLFEIIDDEA